MLLLLISVLVWMNINTHVSMHPQFPTMKNYSNDYSPTVDLHHFSNKNCSRAVCNPQKIHLYPSAHHWCLSDRPFHSGSVRTILSMSFFHSMPSETTRCHSRHTSSAAHRERASRKDRMFSAMCSRPRAGQTNTTECRGSLLLLLGGNFMKLIREWWTIL